MRKEVEVDLDGKNVKVFELRNKDLLVLVDKYGELLNKGITIKDMPAIAKDIIPNCTSLKWQEFEDLPARLTKKLYEAFKELNADFFQIFNKESEKQKETAKTELAQPA